MTEEKDPITSDEFIGPIIEEQLSKEAEYEAQKEFATHKIRQREADREKSKSANVVMKNKPDQKPEPVKDPDCHKSKMESGEHSFSKQIMSRRGYMMRFCHYCGTMDFYTSVDNKSVSWIPKKILDEYEKNKS